MREGMGDSRWAGPLSPGHALPRRRPGISRTSLPPPAGPLGRTERPGGGGSAERSSRGDGRRGLSRGFAEPAEKPLERLGVRPEPLDGALAAMADPLTVEPEVGPGLLDQPALHREVHRLGVAVHADPVADVELRLAEGRGDLV